MRSPDSIIEIELLYALPEEQNLLRLQLPAGCTVASAVAGSDLYQRYPQLRQAAPAAFAVFGRLVAPDTVLRNGDRLEVLRPLNADPKLSRRLRVEAARKAGRR